MEIGAELIECASAETGLPRGRIEGERARTVGQLKLFADVARTGDLLFDESQDEFQSRDV